MVFRNKQSSVFACVWMDSYKEFGVFLKFPLTLDTDISLPKQSTTI